MNVPLSKAEDEFLYDHGGLTREFVATGASEATRWNEARQDAEMRKLAEHPLDLTDVPYAEEVLAALPRGLHPLAFKDFFNRVRQSLRMDGRPVSVREWLVRGGDVETALWCAESEGVLG